MNWIRSDALYFCICAYFTGLVAGRGVPLDVKLLRQLTEVDSYDIRSRPVANLTDRVRVGVSVEINRINHLDDKNEVLSWVGYVNATWNNPNLQWDPREWGGIEYLLMKERDMWVPDISILERLDDDVGFSDQKRRLISVSYLGDIKWFLGGGMLDIPCKLNMRKFPFDTQVCSMSIGSYAMSDKEVEIFHSNASVIGEVLGRNGLWRVSNFTNSMRIFTYSTKTGLISYKYVNIQIHLRRMPSYFVINIILPCVFISVLMCAVFMIPPCGGDKVSFSVTLLVAFNVIQLVIIDMMPQTSESTPIIAIYVTVLMALSALCIPLSVVVITIHNIGDRAAPTFLVKLLLPSNAPKAQTQNLLADCNDHQMENNEHFSMVNNSMESTAEYHDKQLRLLKDIRVELRRFRVEQEEKNSDSYRTEAWQNAARRLDGWFLKIFAPVLIFHTVICLGTMML